MLPATDPSELISRLDNPDTEPAFDDNGVRTNATANTTTQFEDIDFRPVDDDSGTVVSATSDSSTMGNIIDEVFRSYYDVRNQAPMQLSSGNEGEGEDEEDGGGGKLGKSAPLYRKEDDDDDMSL
jgi:hypothetical protein